MKIKIEYDGRVSLSAATVHLGDLPLEKIIAKALNVHDTGWRDINAEVEICINCKPDAPRVWIEEDDEC